MLFRSDAEEMTQAIRQANVYDWTRLYQLQNKLMEYDTEQNLLNIMAGILRGAK